MTVARAEVPFQVNRGRIDRGTSLKDFGGVILIAKYQRCDSSRERGKKKERKKDISSPDHSPVDVRVSRVDSRTRELHSVLTKVQS